MSVSPLGSSAAGSPLPQTHGSDVERARLDAADQAKRAQAQETAQKSKGVGQAEADEQTADRDADGRRLWEIEDRWETEDQPEQKARGDADPAIAGDPEGSEVETSEVETSEVETSEVETSEVETSEVETSEVETSEVETSEVETREAESREETDADRPPGSRLDLTG